jgi:hypothetical protein
MIFQNELQDNILVWQAAINCQKALLLSAVINKVLAPLPYHPSAYGLCKSSKSDNSFRFNECFTLLLLVTFLTTVFHALLALVE